MWINPLDLIFPEECLGCGAKNTLLCRECLRELPSTSLRAGPAKRSGILAATSYESETIRQAIWALKYKRAKKLAEPFAELIYQRLFSDPWGRLNKRPQGSILVPIPLSKKRLRERGFNQTELIAKHLSEKLRSDLNKAPRSDIGIYIGCLTNVLYRNRHTISQVEIKDKEKRLKNLEGAFSVKNPELIKSKTIFVVDDVSTTGATIKEARRVLKAAGAKKVIGLVVAKG